VDQGIARKAKWKPGRRDGRNENGSRVGSTLSVPPANITGIWSVLGWESTLQLEAQVLV